MMGHQQVLELVPLYAVGSLDGGEQRMTETHLDGCQPCLALLDRFRAVTATLVPDVSAPGHLWEGIVDELGEHQ
jgi:anti-sigma factor ChrR (cupin superfamily)